MHNLPASVSLVLPWLLLLSSCAAPPRLPTVDETYKRPANTAMAVELQVCKNELTNNRIRTAERMTTAEATAAAMRTLAEAQRAGAASVSKPNSVFVVQFDYGSTQVSIPGELSAALAEEARQAPLIVLRGRTDGTSDTAAEARMARERAASVRSHLVAAGIDASLIRASYQPVGDHVADNTASTGRARNRRVEIEVYRAAPILVGVSAPMASPSTAAQP